jgi:hypothetical protein
MLALDSSAIQEMLELQVMPPLNEQGNGSDGDRT